MAPIPVPNALAAASLAAKRAAKEAVFLFTSEISRGV